MIIIENKEIANRFTKTFFMMDEFIIFNNIYLINENKFFLFDDDMSKIVEIDLETSNINIIPINLSNKNLNNFKIYNIKDGEMAWSLCIIANEAVMQWKDCTPFRGKKACKNVSNIASRALRIYEMSLELTLNYLKVFQFDTPISYEHAINTLLLK
jgi:hypothetical protein